MELYYLSKPVNDISERAGMGLDSLVSVPVRSDDSAASNLMLEMLVLPEVPQGLRRGASGTQWIDASGVGGLMHSQNCEIAALEQVGKGLRMFRRYAHISDSAVLRLLPVGSKARYFHSGSDYDSCGRRHLARIAVKQQVDPGDVLSWFRWHLERRAVRVLKP